MKAKRTIRQTLRMMAIQISPRMLWARSPWGKAHVIAAAKLYRESPRWSKRAAIVGPEYADQMFMNSRIEIRIFKRKVLKDLGLLAQVVFTPFSVNV